MKQTIDPLQLPLDRQTVIKYWLSNHCAVSTEGWYMFAIPKSSILLERNLGLSVIMLSWGRVMEPNLTPPKEDIIALVDV